MEFYIFPGESLVFLEVHEFDWFILSLLVFLFIFTQSSLFAVIREEINLIL